MESLDVQIYKFVFMVVTGMLAGMLVDIFRGWQLYARPRRWLRHLADALMVASVSCFLVALTVCGTWGEIRLYTLVAVALGWGSYAALASPCCLWLIRNTFYSIGWLGSQVVKPVRIVWKWVFHRPKPPATPPPQGVDS